MDTGITAINDRVKEESVFVAALRAEMEKVIIGQKYLIDRLIVGLLANGHVLLEGVPGLAKTLSVKTLAAAMSTSFQRIQFTPDLLPPISSVRLCTAPKTERSQRRKVLFSRTSFSRTKSIARRKVQSALLEAMQERQVTIARKRSVCPNPFWCLRRRTPSSRRAPIRCPRRKSTASC